MKRCLLPLGVLWLLQCAWLIGVARAQEDDKNVTKEGRYEIARRGNLVEHVGGIQSAEESAVADAIAIPPDDSHKWFISVITKRGCAACDKLRADFATSPILKAWVDVDDYRASWAHFQVFDADDQTQAWRWKELQAGGVPLDRFPILLVQPPVNGSWGDPKSVVMMQVGYTGKPEELDKQLRKSISDYAKRVHPQHMTWRASRKPQTAAVRGGFQQQRDTDFGGPTAPFGVPAPLPAPIPGPFVPQPSYQIVPPGPQPATLAQLQAACPGAPADFLLAQLQAQATLEQAQLAWLQRQQMPKPAPAAQPSVPAPPSSGLVGFLTTLVGLLGVSNFVSLGLAIWAFYRQGRKAQGKELIVPDDIYELIVSALKKFPAQKPAP